jgi:hypothetical protein
MLAIGRYASRAGGAGGSSATGPTTLNARSCVLSRAESVMGGHAMTHLAIAVGPVRRTPKPSRKTLPKAHSFPSDLPIVDLAQIAHQCGGVLRVRHFRLVIERP